MLIPDLYPDIARARGDVPPSLIEADAKEWITRVPLRWTPAWIYSEPADVLTVIGAIVLSAAVRQPLGWDGGSLRGPVDPVRLIARADLDAAMLKGAERMRVMVDGRLVLSMPPPRAAKYWAGQITIDRIWESCRTALHALLDMADDLARAVGPDIPPPLAIGMDARMDEATLDALADHAAARKRKTPDVLPISVTGYDETVVSIPIRDGFSVSAHPRMVMGGQRPAIELYALIGATWVEQAGRWLRPHSPEIPAIRDVALRDRLDLDRLALLGPSLPCRGSLTGKRSYLTRAAA